jgi:hypothetical protein
MGAIFILYYRLSVTPGGRSIVIPVYLFLSFVTILHMYSGPCMPGLLISLGLWCYGLVL